MSTVRRRKELERIREEGRQAVLSGKSRQTNPYPVYEMDHLQWNIGFDQAVLAGVNESHLGNLLGGHGVGAEVVMSDAVAAAVIKLVSTLAVEHWPHVAGLSVSCDCGWYHRFNSDYDYGITSWAKSAWRTHFENVLVFGKDPYSGVSH